MNLSLSSEFPWWRRIPIHTKIQVGTAVFALIFLLGGAVLLTWGTQNYFDQKIRRDLTMLSSVLAENSRAAVLFGDVQSASKVLHALKGNGAIEAAAIYKDESFMATYPGMEDAVKAFANPQTDQGAFKRGNHYYSIEPIIVADKVIGRLMLYSNVSEWEFMKVQLRKLFLSLFAGFVVLLLVIYAGLRAFITQPLSTLSRWATSVSMHKTFNVLAKKEGEDEIGQLVDSLNTMLKELEKQQEIILLNERLTAEIQERTRVERDLVDMRTRAETANEAKTRFIANMSHEIRTPMNVIMGFIEIVLDGNLTDEQRKHLTTARRSAKLLHSLLNDILDISKLEEGKLQLESIPFAVQQVVGDVLKSFEIKARQKSLEFGASIDPGINSNYLGDPFRLGQILINLVGNAIKFTEKGGVYIDVSKTEKSGLLFKVIDTGIGIAEDKLTEVFQNFAQADSSVSRKYGGSGLGTTISKQLVELMGGRIWIESKLGNGSIFSFQVPLLPTEQAATAVSVAHTQPTLAISKPLHILIAEDVKENAELLRVRFSALGHRVTIVSDGNQAVEAVRQGNFDIVLMDVQMPEKDGLTASREIRALDSGKQIPILALTASVLKQNRIACEEAGMNGFVTKPVVFYELFSEMVRVLKVDAPRVIETAASAEFKMPPCAGIDVSKAASLWQDEEVYCRNLELFARSHRDAVNIVRNSIEGGDIPKARKVLHALKGAAGNLALVDVYECVTVLSDALKSSSPIAPGPLLPSLLHSLLQNLADSITRFNITLEEISRARNADAGAPEMTVDFVTLNRMVDDLHDAFDKGDSADERCHQVIDVLRGGGIDQEAISRLRLALDEFEFSRAITLMNELVLQLKTKSEPENAGLCTVGS